MRVWGGKRWEIKIGPMRKKSPKEKYCRPRGEILSVGWDERRGWNPTRKHKRSCVTALLNSDSSVSLCNLYLQNASKSRSHPSKRRRTKSTFIESLSLQRKNKRHSPAILSKCLNSSFFFFFLHSTPSRSHFPQSCDKIEIVSEFLCKILFSMYAEVDQWKSV